jgi:chemotaxis protein CheC
MAMINLTELQQDAIIELLNIGMSRAASALSQMVGEEVYVSIPSVDLLSRHEVAVSIMEKNSERIIAVQQQFSGLFWGDAMLIFPEEKSLELVHSLIQDTFPLEIRTAMEREAFMEIGNIILNACIGTISNILHSEVSCSLPLLLRGSCTDIFDDKPDAQPEEVAVFLGMDFALQERSINGCVVCIIEGNAIQVLRENIDHFLDHIWVQHFYNDDQGA